MPEIFATQEEAKAFAATLGRATRVLPAETADLFPPVIKAGNTVYRRTGVKIHVLGRETLKYAAAGFYIWISWVDGRLVNARRM
jgi:hypothetical protein